MVSLDSGAHLLGAISDGRGLGVFCFGLPHERALGGGERQDQGGGGEERGGAHGAQKRGLWAAMVARVRARMVTIQFNRVVSALFSIGGRPLDLCGNSSAQANSGLPAATAASAVATAVITQLSFRVAFISYLSFLVVSF